ncbi:hypothetical protein TruAng_007420 [Truncatella angustata]|nr:hypothetical protein TruAng_007420 [Truncatella angustata]
MDHIDVPKYSIAAAHNHSGASCKCLNLPPTSPWSSCSQASLTVVEFSLHEDSELLFSQDIHTGWSYIYYMTTVFRQVKEQYRFVFSHMNKVRWLLGFPEQPEIHGSGVIKISVGHMGPQDGAHQIDFYYTFTLQNEVIQYMDAQGNVETGHGPFWWAAIRRRMRSESTEMKIRPRKPESEFEDDWQTAMEHISNSSSRNEDDGRTPSQQHT